MATYRVIKSQDYITMANYHLRDKRLTLAAKGLLSVLLADEGDCDYNVSDLAERGPEGRDAIRSALGKLEDAGYIRRRQGHDGQGRFASNEYLIYEAPLPENPSTVKPSADKPLTENPPTVASEPELELNQGLSNAPREDNPRKKGKEEGIKKPPQAPLDSSKSWPKWKPERFAAFWDFYRTHCRGESRQAAVRAWDKLKPDDALIEKIGRALQRQLRSDEWQRGIAIPYASTYLNQRRWEDEIGPRNRTAPAEDMPSGLVFWTEDMEL